ncbi:hypothetical protein EUX98_g4295 [Antrodiella citrinella]|uniref:Methyltransferase type 11 domain-containing protein n=1 Tax=Antrodiella citrinella TaxID=2447956 RepID=A0A4S4MUJ3_9APHY|nr:hypothetical protein EUX98_g4295 [Antrodiella citrinella]
MLEEARKVPKPVELKGTLEYVQSPAETLPFLEDSSVDVIISAQAAHWFDWQKLWREAARVLRKDGTIAAWSFFPHNKGYSEFRLTKYPSATPLINAYSQGNDPTDSIGPHWERPGRTILDDHLRQIPDPQDVAPDQFHDFQRVFFRGDHHEYLPQDQSKPIILQKTVTWEGLLAYLHTFSAYHTYQQQHPEDSKNSDGDVAVRFWKKLVEHVAEQTGNKPVESTDEIQIEWPIALIVAKRS